ncbi:MAG TPA: SRPBCC family protein [Kribbella sp.]
MAERSRGDNGLRSIIDELPLDRFKDEVQDALSAAGDRAVEAAGSKVSDLTDRLTDFTANGGVKGRALAEGGKAAATGGSPLLGALKGGVLGVADKAKEAISGGGSGGSDGKKPTKSTNIIEEIDVGVPVSVAYNQWTQFQDYSGFMKKVENVEQKSEEKLDFKAKILWSHRTWEATILEQVPDEKIVWRSKGEKGHVDGAVTFHDLAHNLTRILLVLEYYPQGLFERVGNIWRAQGRRARLELKHYRRHVMTRVILEPEKVEGWRGEIHRGKVVRGHGEEPEDDEQTTDGYDDEYDEAEDGYDDEYDEDEGSEDEYDDEPGDEEDEEPADEYDEDEDEEEEEDEEPADEYDEEPADEEDEEDLEPEDEYDEDEEPEDEYDDGEPADESDEGQPADESEDEYGEDEVPEDDEPEDEEAEDEYDDEEPADEYDEDEPADEYEDEYDEDEEPEDEEDDEQPADEYAEDEYEEEPDERLRRRAS